MNPASFRLAPEHRERLRAFLRIAGTLLALDRRADAWLLFIPAFWATWLASRGVPDVSVLIALVLAYSLVRAAVWMWYVPDADALTAIPPPQRRIGLALLTAGLCFAIPLGWPLLVLAVCLALVVLWFVLRRRSYLSQPALAAAAALVVVAAWLAQQGRADKIIGLLVLSAFLWVLAALVTILRDRTGASLAAAFGPSVPLVVAALLVLALLAFYLLGSQAGLGVFYHLGLAAAAVLTVTSTRRLVRHDPVGAFRLQLWWGAAVFMGIAGHYLCACAVPPA